MGVILTEAECQQFVQEMYFGKTPAILEMEAIIHDIRSDYMVDKSQIEKFNLFSNISRDKRLLDLANKMSEIWGYADCSVNVYFSKYENACTYPVTYSVDVEPEKMMVKGANGYKYSKKANFYTMYYISSALMCNNSYTDAEVMAVLVHEVGHSFTAASREKCALVSAFRDSFVFNMIINMLNDPMYAGQYAYSLVVNTNMYKKVMTKINNSRKDGKNVYVSTDKVAEFINNAIRFICLAPFKLTGIDALLTKIDANAFESWISKVSKNDKYMKNLANKRTDEYLSDSFAMMYGYGSDQATALSKMYFLDKKDPVEDFYDKVPLVGKLNQASKFSYWVLAETFSVHPSLPARVDNIIKELEGELKKTDIPPKMKAQIKANIKDLEEFKDAVRKMEIEGGDTAKAKKEWLKKWIDMSGNPDVKNKFENDMMNMKDRDDYYNKLDKEK